MNLCENSIAHLFYFGKPFRRLACPALVSLGCFARPAVTERFKPSLQGRVPAAGVRVE